MDQILPAVFAFLAAGMVACAVITFVVSGAAHELSQRLRPRRRNGARVAPGVAGVQPRQPVIRSLTVPR